MRNSVTTLEEEQGYKTKKQGNNASLARSKTMMGRKLRSMTVEKGLLRETKVVHQMIDALVECRVCYPFVRCWDGVLGVLTWLVVVVLVLPGWCR